MPSTLESYVESYVESYGILTTGPPGKPLPSTILQLDPVITLG